MTRRKHWSETRSCQCGKTFRSYAAEAFHRHNFSALCRRSKRIKTMIDLPNPIAAKAPELPSPAPFDYVDVNLIGADESAIPALKAAGFSVMSARVEQDGDATIFVARLLPPIGPASALDRLAARFGKGLVREYAKDAAAATKGYLGVDLAELFKHEFIEP